MTKTPSEWVAEMARRLHADLMPGEESVLVEVIEAVQAEATSDLQRQLAELQQKLDVAVQVAEAFKQAGQDTIRELYAAQLTAGMTEKVGSTVHGAADRLVAFVTGELACLRARATELEARLSELCRANADMAEEDGEQFLVCQNCGCDISKDEHYSTCPYNAAGYPTYLADVRAQAKLEGAQEERESWERLANEVLASDYIKNLQLSSISATNANDVRPCGGGDFWFVSGLDPSGVMYDILSLENGERGPTEAIAEFLRRGAGDTKKSMG